MRLIVLLLGWPLIEIAVLVMVGGWIGLWATLGLVVGTGFLGVSLLRGGGMRSVSDLRGRMSGMQSGVAEAARGMFTLVAGLLLVLPGFIGDAVGLLLLIPAVQGAVIRLLGAWLTMLAAGFVARGRAAGGPVDGTVIDGTFDVVETEKRPTHEPSGWTRH